MIATLSITPLPPLSLSLLTAGSAERNRGDGAAVDASGASSPFHNLLFRPSSQSSSAV